MHRRESCKINLKKRLEAHDATALRCALERRFFKYDFEVTHNGKITMKRRIGTLNENDASKALGYAIGYLDAR